MAMDSMVASNLAGLVETKVIDDYTIELTLESYSAEFVISLASVPLSILSKAAYEGGVEDPYYIGTGPYKFDEWVEGEYCLSLIHILASAILLTASETLAKKVSEEVDRFVSELPRRDIIQKSLDNYGYILLAENMDETVDIANAIASEHLEIVTRNPFEMMTKIKNAGAIFLGEYSSEPLGDYFAGPNHILPTNGTAKFFSPLGVDDFVKKSSIIYYSKEALEPVKDDIIKFAQSESLTAHANSIKVRFDN